MRCVLLLLVFLFGIPMAVADDEDAVTDPCEVWALHGYRVGMPFDKAQAVRPIKRKGNELRVKEKGRFKGSLEFDGAGLRRYASKLITGALGQKGSGSAALAESVLRQRLGEPADTMTAEKWNPMTGRVQGRATYWTSEECDTLIAVEAATASGSAVSVTQPVLYLRRLSDWRAQTGTIID